MFKLMLKRFLSMIPTLFLGTIFIFGIIHLAPGNYVTYMKAMTPTMTIAQMHALAHTLGLDKPITIQYIHWIGDLLRGNLGTSFAFQAPVVQVVGPRLLNSLYLVFVSGLLTFGLVILLSVFIVRKEGKLIERTISTLLYVLLSIPAFFTALILIYVALLCNQRFGTTIPLFGLTSSNYTTMSLIGKFLDSFKHLLLPSFCVAITTVSFNTRLLKTQLDKCMRAPHLRTARAKGLTEKKSIYRHALKIALLPLIADFGGFLTTLFTSAGLVEVVFNYPGLTPLFIQSIYAKDTPVIAGIALFLMLMLISGNLIADCLLMFLDPRISYERKN